MRAIIEEILNMPYYGNLAATNGKVHNDAKHEDAVENVLRSHNLMPSDSHSSITKKCRDNWKSNHDLCDMREGTYISQPCGTHNSPDFIVKDFGGKVYFLECKSVKKSGTPMYNSGIPTAEYIYILTSKKHDETTVYLGEDVVNVKVEKALEKHIKEARRRDEELNKILSDLGNSHGISYYTRPMIQHKGSSKDYFTNPRRGLLEQRVLEICK